MTGDCAAGYYCTLGAETPTPTDSTGNVCTIGHYCPVGTAVPIPCPDGTSHSCYNVFID